MVGRWLARAVVGPPDRPGAGAPARRPASRDRSANSVVPPAASPVAAGGPGGPCPRCEEPAATADLLYSATKKEVHPRLTDDCPGNLRGHLWGDLVAASGELSRPPLGRSQWPLTARGGFDPAYLQWWFRYSYSRLRRE